MFRIKHLYLLPLLFSYVHLSAQVKNDTIMKTGNLKIVTVAGQKPKVVYKPDRLIVDVSSVTSALGGTAVDVLSTLPSIQIDAEGQVTFRGSSNFLVYIDGKPSPLDGTQALQSIPASMIQELEILTTPSAKYKTEGDVGIINITTKRNLGNGLGVFLNASGSTLLTRSVDGKINYRMGHHNLYLGGQASYVKTKSDFEQYKQTVVDGYTTTSYSDGTRFRNYGTFIGQGGYEFTDGKHHEFTLDLQGGRTRNPRGGDMDYKEHREYLGNVINDNSYDSHDRYKLEKHLFQAATDYTWKINDRGDKVNLNNRFRYDWYSMEYTESNMFDQQGSRYEGTRGYEEEHHWDCDGALSYLLHYGQMGKIETGYQYTTYSEHGDYNIYYWNRDSSVQQFQNQLDLYAPFYYRRQTHSPYVQLSDQYGHVAFDAGLRADRLIDDMDLPTYTSRHRKYWALFPSAHLSYSTSIGSFMAGYSRRTNRPGIWKLEPYITYEDYYTRIIGNPDLDAEYVNSMELRWRKSFENDLSLTAAGFVRQRTDVVDYVRVAYEPGVTLDSIINAGNQWDKGLEFQAVVKPYKWWNTTLNASAYHYKFHATSEGCHDYAAFTYHFGCINGFHLTQNSRFQFDGHLVGPMNLTQGKEKAYVFFDVAYRQSLAKGKLNIGLVAHDVFHTAKYHNRRWTDSLISETWVRPKYPNVVLSLSYHFNQKSAPKSQEGELSKDVEFVGKDF